jgi:hypothetical protein
MPYKICRIIFSTNRLDFLTKTLLSQKNLDFGECLVDSIFIDDFPKSRNDILITDLVKAFGYDEIYLHEKNEGLSVTWTQCWNLIRERDYDYIWHQEDDVEILEPIRILDLIEMLEQDPQLMQVVLARQAWYHYETDPTAKDTDIIFKNYRLDKNSAIFSPMASLYSIDKVRFDYSKWYLENYPENTYHNINLNEGMIGKALLEGPKLISATVKNSQGNNMINHIGDYFVGRRVLPNEPHYEMFAGFNPEKRYNSRNGNEYP